MMNLPKFKMFKIKQLQTMMIQILKNKLEIINQILAKKNMEIKIKKILKKLKINNKYLIKFKLNLAIHNRNRKCKKMKIQIQMMINFILPPLIKRLKIIKYLYLVNLKIIKILNNKNMNKAQMMMIIL